jgi:hypothetical protein
MPAPASLDAFCAWLKETPLSVTLQSVEWVVPAVQTVHILAIAAVAGAALAVAFRSLGLSARDRTTSAVAAQFLPVVWGALPVLLATGLVLIVAEPARALENPVFWTKMTLLGTAIVVTAVYHLPLRRDAAFWDGSVTRKRATKVLAITSLLLWTGIIFAGRWIAYVDAT